MSVLPTTRELVYAPSGNVRIAGFSSRWTGFVNTVGRTKAYGQLLIKCRVEMWRGGLGLAYQLTDREGFGP